MIWQAHALWLQAPAQEHVKSHILVSRSSMSLPLTVAN